MSKVIIGAVTTSASVHDSRVIGEVLNNEEVKGRTLYADSAYSGKELEKLTRSYGVDPCFCEKGCKNRPLTEEQKRKIEKNQKFVAVWSTSSGTLKWCSADRLCAQ